MKNLKGKITLINTISTFFLQAILIINGFVIPKLILDAFGSDVNGLISSLTKFLQYISLVDGGIAGVITAKLYKPLTDNNESRVSSIIVSARRFYQRIGLIFIAYALILSVVYPLCFNTGFSFTYVMSLALILSISFIIQYMISLTYKTLLNADKKIFVPAITQACISLLEIIIAIISIKVYPSVHLLKLLTGLLFLLQPIVYSSYVKKHYKIDCAAKVDKNVIKGRWDGFAINTAAFVHSGTDVAVLTIFSNMATVSVYSVYALVTGGLKNVIISLVSSLNPTLGHAYARKDYNVLNQKLDMYEYVIFMLVFMIFTVAALLITPFVSIYTSGLTDADYYQPLFGMLIVIAEALYLLKFPHLNLSYSADKFKEISKPAFIEAALNILVSVALVPFLGLIGVTIGTIMAMLYRLMFHVYYTSKIVHGRNQWIFYRKLLLFIVFTLIGIAICLLIPSPNNTIINWIWHAVVYSAIIGAMLVFVTLLFFRSEIKCLKNYLKRR